MGRYRSRSRSYSPRRRSQKRYDSPRRRSPPPSGLLVRNVSLHTRPEELRSQFEKFGPVKDVYLPRNYYTGEPRGFGFVKFRYPEDAAEAKDKLNHTVVGGREIRIVFAEENRKTPHEMRRTSRPSGRYGGRRRSPPRSPRHRYRSYSRSPSSGRRHSRSVSRSHSPLGKRDYRSNRRSLSPRESSPYDERGYKSRERSRRNSSPRNEAYKSRRSYSPGDLSPRVEDHKFSRRSSSSREISPHDRKDLKSSRRSVSPRDESPCFKDRKAKERTPTSREVSTSNEDYKASRESARLRELSKHDNRRGPSNGRSPNASNLSPVDEKDYRSKREPLSPEENGENPLVGKDLASRRLVSPRRSGRSMSRSRSRSFSPR